MAERFLFFNAMEIEPGVWDREYQAQHFAEYFGEVLSTGLLHTDKVPGMSVKVEPGTLNTVVSPGKAIMKGHLYENTTLLTLSHLIPESSLDRIDRIVLRLNLRNSERNIHLRVKDGEPSANPVAPELQRDQFIHEISLAQIRVRANTSSLDPLDLKDERMIEDLCGLVYSLISVPTSVFQQQWDTWFNTQKQYYQENIADWTDEQQDEFLSWRAQEEALFNLWMDGEKQDFYDWVATLEGILSGDVAGNLQLQIDGNMSDLASSTVGKGAHLIGLPDPSNVFSATNVGEGMIELFTNVSDGKKLIGGAITDVDNEITLPIKPTFNDLADAIRRISTGLLKPIAGSGTTIYADDTNRDNRNGGLMKIREVRMLFEGSGRVSFSLYCRATNVSVMGRIYINGSPAGLSRTAPGGTRVEFTEDISFTDGDLLQIYAGTTIIDYYQCDMFTISIDDRALVNKIL